MKYIGYLIIVFLVTFFELLFFLLMKLKNYSQKKYFKKEKQKIELTNSLIDLEYKIQREKDLIDKFPTLSGYLSQTRDILIKCPYSFEGLQIDSLRHIPDNIMSKAEKEQLSEEYLQASQSVCELVNELSSILGHIYSINDPWKYTYRIVTSEIKKKVVLQILTILIRLLELKEESEKDSDRFKTNKGQIEADSLRVLEAA